MFRRLLYLLLVFAFVSSACSLFGGATTQPTPQVVEPTKEQIVEATPTEKPVEPQPTATAETPKGLVTSREGVQSATIQIVAQGTFVAPDFNVYYNAAGSGSGFIIDPSGLAITNNHVVTGSAILKVYVGGDTQARNAKIVGVSECSDLAVIDIDGDGFNYLAWSDEAPKVGEDVYAAGFPLGNPEYTITRGIVSKARATPLMSQTSVDNVIEHDATIRPGNSGGPLVTPDGKVLGINYAGAQGGPYYAITRVEADKVLSELLSGNDVASLGINGEAILSQDGSLSGIWVYSVKSGSPADKTGIRGGDIITSLENIILATDGTMNDYCDILRSRKPSDTLNVTVLRYADQTVLTGQINGRELAVIQSFAQDLGNEVDSGNSSSSYSRYVALTDASGSIQVEVPVEWTDTDGSKWETTWGNINITAPSISASPDLNGYFGGWDVPGVFFAASSDLGRTGGMVELLDGTRDWYKNDCRADGAAQNYSDELYEGRYQLWKNCGPNDTWTLVLAARPKENKTAFLILVEMKIISDADLEALDHILQTFVVVGDV